MRYYHEATNGHLLCRLCAQNRPQNGRLDFSGRIVGDVSIEMSLAEKKIEYFSVTAGDVAPIYAIHLRRTAVPVGLLNVFDCPQTDSATACIESFDRNVATERTKS